MIKLSVIVFFVVFILACFWLSSGKYLDKRRARVAKMFDKLNDLCYRYDQKHFNEIDIGTKQSAYEFVFRELPHFENIVYDLKPLRLSWWLDKKTLNELKK